MDRQAFDSLVTQDIESAVADLLPHGAGPVTDHRLRHILRRVAQQVETNARSYYLLNLRTADELAEQFNVTPRRMRAIIANRHERWGTGMKLGKSWVVSVDEVPALEPEVKHRPHSG